MEEDKFDIEKIREEIQKNAKVNANKNIISAYGSIDIDKLLKTVECFRKVPTIDELINENNKLLSRLEELEADNYSANCIISEQIDLLRDSVSKFVIREKIDKLEREFHFFAGREHAEWQDGEFDGDVCDDLALQIGTLKGLLGEEI